MTHSRAIRELRALKKDVLADERVDWDETERLLTFIRPLAAKYGDDFARYEELLEKCRADGKITDEESTVLALNLDLMCSRFEVRRLRFWLIVSILVILVLAVFA